VKKETDEQKAFFEKEITGAKAYQKQLEGEIAQLTAKQQQLLAQKLASLGLPSSLGAGPLHCTDDRSLDPGFRPAFAFFSYGIPHRVGLNQYGAFGRAKAGQSYQDILRAYFDDVSFEKRDAKMKIKVQGHGEMELDQYLLGIYEMPGDWPLEALKAQVVAARSYALSYTDNGAKEICTTQACQVYKGGNKGGNWEAAVRATEGEVLVHSGQVVTAWYASTFGGYSFTSGDVWGGSNRPWTKRMRDTTGDVSGRNELLERAYDRDSPCFYAAQGWRTEYAKSAWLKGEEVSDIVNVILLAKSDSSVQSHLSQTDKPNPDGVETWSADRVRQELSNRGVTPFTSVSDVSMSMDFSSGRTTSVTVSGNAGSQSFSGDEFRSMFNLRAPANIQIVSFLFQTEKK
jgi:SpoIID/LytB domain protein